jgi:hypothetical protein
MTEQIEASSKASPMTRTNTIEAKLTGKAVVAAEGYTVRDQLPVIALCRLLLAEGFDPASPMHVYRGDTLALKVRTIGEAARLRPATEGRGFIIDKMALQGHHEPAGESYPEN